MTYHVTRIQLDDFEVPDIAPGHTLKQIEIAAQDGRTRYHRLYADNYGDSKAMIDSACLYIIRHVGWSNAKIELVLVRDDDRNIEGRMVYDCDSDCWTQFVDEIDAVPLGVMPTVAESDTPTGVIHPRYAEIVGDEEIMPIV
jgi:hypothetical protein